jgi:hypothetical protein
VFKRTLGSKREPRPAWTVAEQNKLIELISTHLQAPATGGRYSRIDWAQIEQNFNSFFSNKTHTKGEMTAETKYSTRGKEMVAKPRKLGQNRAHVPRSAGAIENQSELPFSLFHVILEHFPKQALKCKANRLFLPF